MTSIHGKQIVLAALVTIAAGALLRAPARAGEITVTYRFDAPAVERLEGGFERIVFPATVQSGLPGEPGYPFRGAAILLPPGEGVARVRTLRRGRRELPGSHLIRPVQHQVPMQESEIRTRQFLFSVEAYAADRWVDPSEPRFTTQYCCGHAIAVGCLSPLVYHPKDGAVGWYDEIEVTIETEASTDAVRSLALLRTDPATCERIAAIVDNPGGLAAYPSGALAAPDPDSYDYLIVTRDSLQGALAPFRDYHTRRGMRARIRTVEQIEADFLGRDTAERIRNAIIHEYIERGISYVLLAGDSDGPVDAVKPVPHRGLYCNVPHEQEEEPNIPADIYYSALDGDWNADGDSLWGEPGEEDLYPELSIGRACVQNTAEATRFAGKTMLYQTAPVAGQVRRALLLGEQLWDNPETWGADELEELVGTCTHNDITTTGIPPDYFIDELFSRDIYIYYKEDVLAKINPGTHWVVHSGHATQATVMRLYLNDVTDFKFTNDGVNTNFIIIATAGCYAASFDNRDPYGVYSYDCIAEKMLKIQHCAIAFRGNSRFGWLDPGTTSSTSHLYLREFYDAIFSEGYHLLGDALRRSSDEMVPYVALSEPNRAAEFMYDYYQINLLGDPALDAWTDTPEQLSVPHPAAIGRWDESMAFLVPEISSLRASLYHDGVCYGWGVGSPLGYVVMHRLLPFPDSLSTIELNVTAHDYYTYRDTLAISGATGVDETPTAVTLSQNSPNPFNPSTTIRFTLDTARYVDLRAYDIAGREVERLVERRMEAGSHAVTWRPRELSSGVYLYVLRAGDITLSGKAVLVR